MNFPEYPYAVFHALVRGGCGGIAYLYKEMPKRGDVLRSDLAIYLDGTKPVSGKQGVCSTCGKEMAMSKLEDVVRREMLSPGERR